jgi:hypothetical protein
MEDVENGLRQLKLKLFRQEAENKEWAFVSQEATVMKGSQIHRVSRK